MNSLNNYRLSCLRESLRLARITLTELKLEDMAAPGDGMARLGMISCQELIHAIENEIKRMENMEKKHA